MKLMGVPRARVVRFPATRKRRALALQLIAFAVVVFVPQMPEFVQNFLKTLPAFFGVGDVF
jgi:hypothetical protein